jgi:hypothetical protein
VPTHKARTSRLSPLQNQSLSHRPNFLDELVNAFLEDDLSLDLEDEDEPLQPMKKKSNGLTHFQHHSQLLMAVVEPGSFTLRYANDYFWTLMGMPETGSTLKGQRNSFTRFITGFEGYGY